jgi:hypothetical protein
VNSEKYIGLDVHQATTVVAVMDSSGKLVMESITCVWSVSLRSSRRREMVRIAASVVSAGTGSRFRRIRRQEPAVESAGPAGAKCSVT